MYGLSLYRGFESHPLRHSEVRLFTKDKGRDDISSTQSSKPISPSPAALPGLKSAEADREIRAPGNPKFLRTSGPSSPGAIGGHAFGAGKAAQLAAARGRDP